MLKKTQQVIFPSCENSFKKRLNFYGSDFEKLKGTMKIKP